MDEKISQGRLKELLHYDPDTGIFTWKIAASNRVKPGDRAGSKGSNGYIVIKISNKDYKAHRLAWLYMYGAWPIDQLDHINGARADNRFSNLREATRTENMQNRRANTNSKTGYLGVSLNGSKYRARIGVNGTKVLLGTYDVPEQAHQAYLSAKAKFHNFQPIPRAK